jgi:hypothetical protein
VVRSASRFRSLSTSSSPSSTPSRCKRPSTYRTAAPCSWVA